jgi:hypothetical protein
MWWSRSDIKGKKTLFEEHTLREEVTLAEGRTLVWSHLPNKLWLEMRCLCINEQEQLQRTRRGQVITSACENVAKD